MTTASLPRLGLRENAGQFALLVGVNGLVGGMIGQERTVLSLLAREVFGLIAFTVVMSFVLAFGVTKALANRAAGALSDRYGNPLAEEQGHEVPRLRRRAGQSPAGPASPWRVVASPVTPIPDETAWRSTGRI